RALQAKHFFSPAFRMPLQLRHLVIVQNLRAHPCLLYETSIHQFPASAQQVLIVREPYNYPITFASTGPVPGTWRVPRPGSSVGKFERISIQIDSNYHLFGEVPALAKKRRIDLHVRTATPNPTMGRYNQSGSRN